LISFSAEHGVTDQINDDCVI